MDLISASLGLGSGGGGWASTRWEPLDSSLTCRYRFLRFTARALTDEWTVASFLQLPLAQSSQHTQRGGRPAFPCLARPLAHSRARPPVGPGQQAHPSSYGEVRLPRPHPLLPSGLLSCFLKPILFVFNIVIFCLMLYYSYGYYSFISLQ